MSRWLLGLILSSLIGSASANIGSRSLACVRNDMDICGLAKSIALFFSDRLPIQINDMVTMESAHALMTNVVIVMRIEKKKGDEFRTALAELPDEGASIKTMVVERIVRNGCDDENNALFISSGGRITYQFFYADGTLFSSADVSTCALNF